MTIILFVHFGIFGQEMTVIDHKGTRFGVKNNMVTTAATPPNNPLENDIWFDTAADLTKVYDGSDWLIINVQALAMKENASNKSIDTNLGDATNTKFPTELAVKTYVDGQLIANIDDDITGVAFDGTNLKVDEGMISFSANLSALEESVDIAANTTLINNHIASDGDTDDTNEIQNAEAVAIDDTSGNFTAENVESALAELATATSDNIFTINGVLTGDRAVILDDFDLNFDTNTIVVSGDDNRVGIGTETPTNTLTINSQEPQLDLTDNSGVRFQLGYSETNTLLSNSLPAQIITNTTGDIQYSSRTSGSDSKHIFFTPSAGAPTERMRIGNNGYVGIGTTTPDAQLDIEGKGVPLKIAPSTITPTGSQTGQIFMGTDGILYAYDGTRGKWLSVDRNSVSWSYNSANLTNNYLKVHDGAISSNNGYRMLRNATITGIAAQTGSAKTWTLIIVDEVNVIAMLSMSIVDGQHANNMNIDVNEGDAISAYCLGLNIDYPLASIEFAWRK